MTKYHAHTTTTFSSIDKLSTTKWQNISSTWSLLCLKSWKSAERHKLGTNHSLSTPLPSYCSPIHTHSLTPSSGYNSDNSSPPLNDFWQPLISGHTCVWHPLRERLSVSLSLPSSSLCGASCLRATRSSISRHQVGNSRKKQVLHLNTSLLIMTITSGILECEGFISYVASSCV